MVQMIIRRPQALVICKNLVLALLATAPDEGLPCCLASAYSSAREQAHSCWNSNLRETMLTELAKCRWHIRHTFSLLLRVLFLLRFTFNRVSSSIVLLHCGIVTQEMSFYLNFMGYGIHMLLVSLSFCHLFNLTNPLFDLTRMLFSRKEGNICRPAVHR